MDNNTGGAGAPKADPEKHPLRVLRKLLNWKMPMLAERAGFGAGENGRLRIQSVESGKNQGGSADLQIGLAQAFQLTVPQIRDLLSGALSPEDARRLCPLPSEPNEATDRYPARVLACRFSKTKGVPEDLLEEIRNDPDLNTGKDHQKLRWWMALIAIAHARKLESDPAYLQRAVRVMNEQSAERKRAEEDAAELILIEQEKEAARLPKRKPDRTG